MKINTIITSRGQKYFLKRFYIFKKIYLKYLLLKLRNIQYNNAPILYKTPFYKIKIWLNLRRDVDRGIFYGSFEFDNAFIFFDFIKQGDVILDIGANIGFYSLLAAKKLQDTGKVYSFEPSKFVLEELKTNIEINKYYNVEAFDFALSDTVGKRDFYKCEDDAYNSLITKPMLKVVSTDVVEVITIDEFVKINNIKKIDIIKIDAEGLDFAILKGALETLKKFRPIIFCEYNNFYLNDNSKTAFINYLEENGYELLLAKKNKLSLSIEKFYQSNKSASEIICLPKIK